MTSVPTIKLRLSSNLLRDAVLVQVETESQPRKRFGLFEGFRKRNQSESAAGSRGTASFRLWGSKQPVECQPQAIAESEDGDGGDDVFVSPRCGMCCAVAISLPLLIGCSVVQWPRVWTLSPCMMMEILLQQAKQCMPLVLLPVLHCCQFCRSVSMLQCQCPFVSLRSFLL